MDTKGFPLKGLSVDLKHNTWHWLVYDARGGCKPEPALFLADDLMPGGGVWEIAIIGKLTAHEAFMKFRYIKPLEMIKEG
jgi:hypothetical protein